MKLTIKMVTEEYSRTESGKSWRKKPDTVSAKNITREQYNNVVDATPFFRRLGGVETVTKAYTCIGYVPIQISSINPSKTVKIIRRFEFECI